MNEIQYLKISSLAALVLLHPSASTQWGRAKLRSDARTQQNTPTPPLHPSLPPPFFWRRHEHLCDSSVLSGPKSEVSYQHIASSYIPARGTAAEATSLSAPWGNRQNHVVSRVKIVFQQKSTCCDLAWSPGPFLKCCPPPDIAHST